MVTILTTGALLAGATFAYFSDTATSNDNVFSAGTLDLRLTDNNETDQKAVTASFGMKDMAPGTCTTGTLYIQNKGSVAANHVDISITNTYDAMADKLRVKTLTYDAVSELPLPDANGNGFSDLTDLKFNPLVNLPLTLMNVNYPLVMEVCLDVSATNVLQGASNTVNMTVFLDQGPH